MLRGPDAAVAGMGLTCQVDDSQYVIRSDFESMPCGAEQLGYSPGKDNGLGLNMVCLNPRRHCAKSIRPDMPPTAWKGTQDQGSSIISSIIRVWYVNSNVDRAMVGRHISL